MRTVRVYGQRVPLPSRSERRMTRGATLANHLAVNAEEHDAGCHGDDCDGRCAERTYARWSAVTTVAENQTEINRVARRLHRRGRI